MKLLGLIIFSLSIHLHAEESKTCELPAIFNDSKVITLRFPKNSSQFLPQGDVAEKLQSIINAKSFISKVEIHGHSSAKRLSNPKATEEESRQHNLILSQERADIIVDYLIGQGFAPQMIQSAAHGSNKPLINEYTSKAFKINRRVEVKLFAKPGCHKSKLSFSKPSLKEEKSEFEKVFPKQSVQIVDTLPQKVSSIMKTPKQSRVFKNICRRGKLVIPYPKGQSLILPERSSKLIQKLAEMKKRIKYISIEAHASKEKLDDSRYTLYKSIQQNVQVAEERLGVLKEGLKHKGLPSWKIRTVNFGIDKPVTDQQSDIAHNNNRRMEIIVKCL